MSRQGLAILALGATLLAAVHFLAPGQSLPLYDGFIPEDPYRFLDPPPGQYGDPGHFSKQLSLHNGHLPIVSGYTTEYPPQAQVFALRNAFVLPRGAQGAQLTIDPIEPPQPVPDGMHLVGNAYRIALVTSDGADIPFAPGQTASVLLRGVAGDTRATMYQFRGNRWSALKTAFGGGTMRMANVGGLGDFALIAEGPTPTYAPPAAPSGFGAPSESPAPTATPAVSTSAGATPSQSPLGSIVPSQSPLGSIMPSPSPSPSPSPRLEPSPSPRATPSATPSPVPLPTASSTASHAPGQSANESGAGSTGIPAIGLGVVAIAMIAVLALVLWIWRRRRSALR
jgi:hypothetical protein